MEKSKFNINFSIENNQHIIYNSLTGAAYRVDRRTYLDVERLLSNPDNENNSEIKSMLIKGGFIVKHHLDEINRLKARIYTKRYSDNYLYLTILPTLKCNFKCSYCYQYQELKYGGYDITSSTMSTEISERIIDFIASHIRGITSLTIDWYGGEPLLESETIIHVSKAIKKICDNYECTYNGHLISNGFLLTKEVAYRLLESGINSTLITIDGPAEMHNIRRPLTDGGNTFDTIITNIEQIIDIFHSITIRVNVDKQNIDTIPKLINFLDEKKFSSINNLSLVIALTAISTEASLLTPCLVPMEGETSLQKILSLWQYAFKKGFNIILPKVAGSIISCHGLLKNFYVIDPMGDVFKCISMAGDSSLRSGVLNKMGQIEFNESVIPWLVFNPFENDKCKKCAYLPICLGGCPFNYMMVGIKGRKKKRPNTFKDKMDCQYYARLKLKYYLLFQTRDRSKK